MQNPSVKTSKSKNIKKVRFLFVARSGAAQVSEGKNPAQRLITMTDAEDSVLYFSERPARLSAFSSLSKGLGKIFDQESMRNDPPNAAIVCTNSKTGVSNWEQN